MSSHNDNIKRHVEQRTLIKALQIDLAILLELMAAAPSSTGAFSRSDIDSPPNKYEIWLAKCDAILEHQRQE